MVDFLNTLRHQLSQIRSGLRLSNLGHGLAGVWMLSAAIATATEVSGVLLLERQIQSLFFELRGAVPAPANVVILAIDEQSLAQEQIYRMDPQEYAYLEPIQAWPWRRAAYAVAIERLMASGARAVAVDVLFTTPSSYGTADDEQLRQTLERHKSRVVLAANYETLEDRQGQLTQLTLPHPYLRLADGVIGFINFWVEPNGKIHRLGRQFPEQLTRLSPKPLATLQLEDPVPDFAQATLQAAQLPVPSVPGNQLFFYGPAGTFEQIPFWHVLDPTNWNSYLQRGQYFKDKIVVIGATARVTQDFHPAPFSKSWLYPEAMSGVEIQANAIATLLENRTLRWAIPHSQGQGILVLMSVGLAGVILGRIRRALPRGLGAVGLICGWGSISYLAFVYGWILPTAAPLAAIAAIGLSYFTVGTVNEQLRKNHLRRTLQHYAASPIVQEIISQQDDLQDLLLEREQATLGKKLMGRYKVIQVLGSGGFSETYVAEDSQRPGHPQCLVKQLRPASNSLKMLQLSRRLFQREAETLERLGNHDQIPKLLAYFEERQEFYLVQELVVGHPLSHELPMGKQVPEIAVIAMLQDLLSVLDFVHSQGVIHRDIKPSNIIRRDSDGKLVLIDFGAVKEIQQPLHEETPGDATVGIGTKGYMPMEQCAGNPRFNSDIYAVGMTAVRALTGIPLYQIPEDPDTGVLRWTSHAKVSHELTALINQMVHYDFRQRYQSVAEVLTALQALSHSNWQLEFPAQNFDTQNFDAQNFNVLNPHVHPPQTLAYGESTAAVDAIESVGSTLPWLDSPEPPTTASPGPE